MSYWPVAKQVAEATRAPQTIDPETGEITSTPPSSAGSGPDRPTKQTGYTAPHVRRGPKPKPKTRRKKKLKHSNTLIVPGDGRPCPRCQRLMQVREHRTITDTELRRPFYLPRWYRCVHDDCKTTMVSFDEDRVYPAADPYHQDIALVDPNEIAPWEDATLPEITSTLEERAKGKRDEH